MKKYLSFYHIVITASSEASGEQIIAFDDFYTPETIKDLDTFRTKSEEYLRRLCSLDSVKNIGGHLSMTITSGSFNNGTGRSLKSHTNHASYLVKEVGVGLEHIGADGAADNALEDALDWLRNQHPPF